MLASGFSRSIQYLVLMAFLFVVASGAAAKAEGGNKIAVMRFEGPQIVDVDADEIWKIKNKVDPPSKQELTNLTSDLQKSLIAQLQELVGKSVVSKSDLDKVVSQLKKESAASMSGKISKELGAKYLVTGVIDRVEFDGNTVLKDQYVLTVTTKLVEASSGKRIWLLPQKKYKTKAFTRKTGGTVYDLFAKKQIPEVASQLASEIASKVAK